MNFEDQIIFFFSAIGAFNGLLISLYFIFTAEKKNRSNYFLGLLLLMLSIRILKSVFFHFYPQLSSAFIQVGLSACILIGPFLFLYLQSSTSNRKQNWLIHVLPYLVGITLLGIFFPFVEHPSTWSNWVIKGIYFQWLIYIILSIQMIIPSIKRLTDFQKLQRMDIWIVSVCFGVVLVWGAYIIGAYKSHLVGALSFTFIHYLVILLVIFKIKRNDTLLFSKEKYQNKELNQEIVTEIQQGIVLIKEKELFLNPSLTLDDVAGELNITKNNLSQYLNETVGKSFSTYINDLRIERAIQLLHAQNNYTIDSIGYESGFNSKSTFYTTFKKITGISPGKYRKSRVF